MLTATQWRETPKIEVSVAERYRSVCGRYEAVRYSIDGVWGCWYAGYTPYGGGYQVLGVHETREEAMAACVRHAEGMRSGGE